MQIPNLRPLLRVLTKILWGLLLVLGSLAACAELEEPSAEDIRVDYRHDNGPWLTWEGDPSQSITISWISAEPERGSVLFGLNFLDAENISETPTSTPTRLHHIRLDGLLPDTQYSYALPNHLDLSGKSLSRDGNLFSFRTAPAAPRPLRIGVVGDMQPANERLLEQNLYMAKVLAGVEVDAWVQVGDAVQLGHDLEHWHRLLSAFPFFAANTPLLAVIGNHDLYGDDGANWREIFTPPQNPVFGRHYYSVDLLNVRLIMLDNFDGSGRPSNTQLQWLEETLSDAREKHLWTFVFMHLSILSTGTEGMKFSQQEAIAPLMAQYAVDGVFYGHDHMYEHFEYRYGATGLYHDPSHAAEDAQALSTGAESPFAKVHYWMSGGGGAALENEYGLTTHEPEVIERRWFDAEQNAWRDIPFERRPWNDQRFIEGALKGWAPGSKNYFHDCEVECYQDDAALYGHDYGENTLQYMIIEVDGDTCTISAHHPDGSILSGADQTRLQQWTFHRPETTP